LADKVENLKYSVDGFREAVEELQLNIDILEEKMDEMCEQVYDTLELQIKALKQLPGAKKKWTDKLNDALKQLSDA